MGGCSQAAKPPDTQVVRKRGKFGRISCKIGLWMGKMEIWKGDCRNLFEILTYRKGGKTNWNVCTSRIFFVPSQPEIEISKSLNSKLY